MRLAMLDVKFFVQEATSRIEECESRNHNRVLRRKLVDRLLITLYDNAERFLEAFWCPHVMLY